MMIKNWFLCLILCLILTKVTYAQEDKFFTKFKGSVKERSILKAETETLILKQKIADLEKEKSVLESMLNMQSKGLRLPGLIGADNENLNKLIHLNLGFAYGRKGDTKEAVREYRKALQYDPEDKDIHYNLGYLLSKQKRYKEAIEEYKKALAGSSQDKEVYYNLVLIYTTGLKDKEASREYYQKYLDLSLDDTANLPKTEEPPQKN